MRILITGSRHWTDRLHLEQAIWEVIGHERRVVIIHGDCPTGADRLARRLADAWNITQEPYPADWNHHGKAAGPIRNQEMVDAGADICLAFPLGESRGTRDCMRRAEAAGIPVINYGDAP